jgi:hypothetical protein
MSGKVTSSSQGAPCPIKTTPTVSCERSRFRAAREPRAEITGCPRDWRISSRIESKLSRNSTCTIVVIVLRNACLSEQSCAETRRNLGSFRWGHRDLAVAIASRPHRRQGMPLPKPNWACSLSPICQPQVYVGTSSSGTSSSIQTETDSDQQKP